MKASHGHPQKMGGIQWDEWELCQTSQEVEEAAPDRGRCMCTGMEV